MASTKTIVLSGTETKVDFNGSFAWLRNDSAATLYASASPKINEASDGVVSIPAGGSAPVFQANGTVYLRGSGSVQLIGSDFSSNPFKTVSANGSGTDNVARAAIQAHESNGSVHVTESERSVWNSLSNPNLLDNPDFQINQRKASGTITTPGYFVDRWKLVSGSVAINTNGTMTLNGTIAQILEKPAGTDFAVSSNAGTASYDNSTKTFSLTASGEIISWAKLEYGSAVTPFLPSNPALELAKCQRFFCMYSHQNTTTSADKCTIGVAYALTSTIIYAVLPIKSMRSGVSSAINYNGISLISGTETSVNFSGLSAVEQTDNTIQLAFTVSEQVAGTVYRIRLMSSDAYLSISKDL